MVHKDPLAKRKKHQKSKYMYDRELKVYGSMFFWFYSILCFSDFNCSLFRRTRELYKKIDTKVLMALELVKFTTTYNSIWDYLPRKKPISYRNLIIVWWLIFDKESAWNRELERILKWTAFKDILELPTPISYNKFFWSIDSEWIDKINFRKFLSYIPKEMFIEAIALVLKCYKTELTYKDDLWDNEILWKKWWTCAWWFRRAVKNFIKKPTQKEISGKVSYEFIDSSEWLALINDKAKRKNIMEKLDWDADRLWYTEQYKNREPSNENWENTMEIILRGIEDEKERLEGEWFDIRIKSRKIEKK